MKKAILFNSLFLFLCFFFFVSFSFAQEKFQKKYNETKKQEKIELRETQKSDPNAYKVGTTISTNLRKKSKTHMYRRGATTILHKATAKKKPTQNGTKATLLSENFETGVFPTGWTTINNDSDTYNWDASVLFGEGEGNNNSQGFISSASYHNPTYTPLMPDNWLITPQVSLPSGFPATLSFWYKAQDPDFSAEVFSVLISTTGTTIADFTAITSDVTCVDDSWHEQMIDLSSYAGQNIYVAIRHYDCTDQFLLCIDDFVITDAGICPQIQNLADNITGNNLEVNWTISTAPDSYEISLNGNIIEAAYSGTATSYDFGTLTDGYYNVSIIPSYSDGCITLSAATLDNIIIGNYCNWTITSWDAYGDGWNNAYLDIIQNGTVIATIANENLDGGFNSGSGGEYNTHIVPVFLGNVDFVWHSGSYDAEVGLEIVGFSGAIVYSAAGNGSNAHPDFIDGATIFTTNNVCQLYNDDVVALSITSLVSGFNLTNAEQVTINVKNNGQNAISSLPIELIVDGGTAQTETWTGTIASLATQTITLTNTADLSASGSHTVKVVLNLSSDANNSNDTLQTTLANIITPIAYTHDAYVGDVTNGTYNALDVNTGLYPNQINTLSTTVFPIAEAYDNNYGVIYRILSNNTLGVVLTDGSFVELGVLSGGTHTGAVGMAYNTNDSVLYFLGRDANNAEMLYSVDLSTLSLNYIGTGIADNVVCRGFEYANDGYFYSLGQDGMLYKIDPSDGSQTSVGNTGITIAYAQELAFDKVLNRMYSYTCDGSSSSKYGYFDLTTGAFTLVHNNTLSSQVSTIVILREGAPCDEITSLLHTVTGNNLEINWTIATAPDSYEISLNGNIIEAAYSGTATSYDFGTLASGIYNLKITPIFSTSCISANTTLNNIVVGDHCMWTVNMTDGYGDGWNGNAALLVIQGTDTIQTIKLQSGSTGTITFPVFLGNVDFVWSSGSYDSENGLDIIDFLGATVFSISGLSNTPNGTIIFTTNNLCQLPSDDVAILSITSPVSEAALTNAEQVTINVKNNGQNVISSLTLELIVDGGTAQTETWTGNIASLATQSITLTNTADLSTDGSHAITVTAILAGDVDNTNDSQTINLINCLSKTLPFTEGFENNADQIPNCWQTIDADGDILDWYVSESNSQYAEYTSHSGTYYAASSSYYSGAITPDNYLITPQIAMNADETIIMTYWRKASFDPDFAEHYAVMISTTTANASEFTEIYSETLTDTIWTEKTIDLSSFAGQNIYIAFRHYNCTNQDQFMIDDINIDFGASVICNLENAAITNENNVLSATVEGEQGNLTYVWSTEETTETITATESGTYSVTIIDDITAGCTATASLVITVTTPTCNLENAAITNENNVLSATVEGEQGNLTYVWSTEETTETITATESGSYSVTITDDITANCTATASIFVNISSISENENSSFNVYPNPSNGLINITVKEKSNVEVYDVTGKLLENFYINAEETRNLKYSAGVYFVKVNNFVERIIIE